MANIFEKNEWQAIPQIEDGEVFDGGIDGNANKQAKALANRTAYLKETIQTHTHNPVDIGAAPAAHASTATTYGVSSASNYGHAKASGAAPLANGTANVGTDNGLYARGDHVGGHHLLSAGVGIL